MAIVITQKWTATRMIITVWADMTEDLIVMTTKRRMNRRRKMTSTKIQL